jgi:hypothetical protein
MNDVSLASAFIAARLGEVQLAVAGEMLRMNDDTAPAAASLIDAGRQSFDRLANVAAGIGTNLDVSA